MTWTEFIEANYDTLVRKASGLTHSPEDLVHHCYLRVFEKEVDNKGSYFDRTMWREVTDKDSSFRKNYTYYDDEVAEEEIITDLSDKITKARIDFMLYGCTEFQRLVYEIWSEGYNMSEVSRESGVSRRTMDYALQKVRMYLKENL